MIGINDLRKGQSVSSIIPTYRTLVEALPRDGAQVFAEIDAVCSHAQSPADSSLTVDGLHLSPLGYETAIPLFSAARPHERKACCGNTGEHGPPGHVLSE